MIEPTVTRASFSNQTIDAMIADVKSGWTRNIPFAVLTQTLNATDDQGLMVKPAKDSEAGRGSPVFDLYHPDLPHLSGACTEEIAVSLKISKEERLPRSIPLTCGTDRHVEGVYLSVRNNKYPIPLYVFNFDGMIWQRIVLDAAKIFRENLPENKGKTAFANRVERGEFFREQGGSNVVTLSEAKRPGSGGKVYTYTYLRINIKPAIAMGYGQWHRVERPSLPKTHPFPA